MAKMKALKTFHRTGGRVTQGETWDEENKNYANHLVRNEIAEYVNAENPGPENPGGPPTEPEEPNEPQDEEDLAETAAKLDEFRTHDDIDAYAEQLEIPEGKYPTGEGVTLDNKRGAIMEYLTE